MKEALFYNRELSWLSFNERVLEEAEDKKNPLLTRIQFLAIFSSNLDEFFMIRVANLKDMVAAGFEEKDFSGLTPSEQLKLLSQRIHILLKRQYQDWAEIKEELKKHSVFFEKPENASAPIKNQLQKIFEKQIFPVITPMGIDPTHPFPFIYNKTLNIFCRLASPTGEEKFAIIPVPSILPRFFKIEEKKRNCFFMIEDLLIYFADYLFPGYKIVDNHCFRITRNADIVLNEDESEDFLKAMQERLKERRKGAVVRLGVDKNLEERFIQEYKRELEITEDEIYQVDGSLDLTFCFSLSEELSKIIPNQTYPVFHPVKHCIGDFFDFLKKQSIIFHHPYESFDCVIDFLKQAASDPRVLAIKQTLYRSSGENSQVVEQLMKAAENGKQVTVLLELRARFDEEKNINWAKKLEEVGCHVIYGVKGLKTHAKALLVVRKEENGMIKRYMHLGTGNYNEKTARIYTDISLFTSDDDIAVDISSFFNYLTGFSIEPEWKKIAISPHGIKKKILYLIDNEIKKHQAGVPGRIIAKMNALVDQQVIEKLYEASFAGVEIDLIVRGICCLKPNQNIRVRSIVGRFLEHSRILFFKNGGDELYFISSADWMPRNLDRRIELLIPIEDEKSKKKLRHILEYNLKDNQKARILKDGVYIRAYEDHPEKEIFNCHEAFMREAGK